MEKREPESAVLTPAHSHIKKYTDKYSSLYPSAQILLVQSYSSKRADHLARPLRANAPALEDWFWSSKNSKNAYVQPILRFLDAEKLTAASSAAPPKPLFVHSFSNGGAIVLAHLAEMAYLRQVRESPRDKWQPLPLKSLVLDSAPGSATALRGLLRAFTAGITNPIIRYPIYAALTTVWAVLRLYMLLARPKPFAIEKLRQDLNDGRIFPLTAKRLYIYSGTDELIMPEDIESNIEAARRAGIDVSVEKYTKSPHVAHARTDGTR